MTRLAVIGAGVAGLAAARELAKTAAVTVFEKSRGLGGRAATRRQGPFEFDHGAQYFTARDERFRRCVERLVELGAVERWSAMRADIDRATGRVALLPDDGQARWVGAPRMSALGRALAGTVEVRREARVVALRARASGWELQLEDATVDGPFEWVVVAIPAPQAAALLPGESPLRAAALDARTSPVFALMLGLERSPTRAWDVARVRNSPLTWVALDTNRGGTRRAPAIVAHASHGWSTAHLEKAPEALQPALTEEALLIAGLNPSEVRSATLHRWRYATCEPLSLPTRVDVGHRLAVCGDWTRGPRIEDAFLSGLEAAEELTAARGSLAEGRETKLAHQT